MSFQSGECPYRAISQAGGHRETEGAKCKLTATTSARGARQSLASWQEGGGGMEVEAGVVNVK